MTVLCPSGGGGKNVFTVKWEKLFAFESCQSPKMCSNLNLREQRGSVAHQDFRIFGA